MAVAALPALGALASTATAYATGTLIAGSLLTTFAVNFGASLAMGLIGSALTPKPKQPTAGTFTAELRDRLLTTRQPIAPREIVYGKTRKGGTRHFEDSSGTGNEFFHTVIALADHRVKSIGEMYVDGEPVGLDENGEGTGRFKGFVQVYKKLGTEGQTAFQELIDVFPGRWTSAHRLRGMAVVYVRLKYDADVWPGGFPNITFDVEGKDDIYDPRTDSYGYSQNMALCLADYLRSEFFGLGVTSAELPDDELAAAANICDEAVSVFAGFEDARIDDGTPSAPSGGVAANFNDDDPDTECVTDEIEGSGSYVLAELSFEEAMIRGFSFRSKYTVHVEGYVEDEPNCRAEFWDGSAWIGFGSQFTVGEAYTTVDIPANAIGSKVRVVTLQADGDGYDRVSVHISIMNVDKRTDTPLETTEARYTCNGVILSSATAVEIITQMAAGMGGYAVVTGGNRWWLRPGAYSAPVVSLDEGDFRGPIKVSTRITRRQNFNSVKGVYSSPMNQWQPADYPALSIDDYVEEDGGEIIWNDLPLPLTTSAGSAQRIARVHLERTRRQITIDAIFSLKAWRAVPGDTVALTFARYGWSGKVFEVARTSLTTIGDGVLAVEVSLREIDANAFAWDIGDQQNTDLAPTTNLPSAFAKPPAPSDFSAYSGTDVLYLKNDGTVVSRMLLTWDDPDYLFVDHLELQYRRTSDDQWHPAIPVPLGVGEQYIWDVEDGDLYDARIRSVTGLGVRGPWASVIGHEVLGKSAPPSNITGFAYSLDVDGLILTWDQITDIDRDDYLIYRGADFGTAELLFSGKALVFRPGHIIAGTNTYWAVARDTSGNVSVNPTALSVAVPFPPSVTGFRIAGRVLSWDEIEGFPALAGYQIRITLGNTSANWDEAAPLHEGILTDSPYTLTGSLSGSLTLLIRALDVFGNVSANSAVIRTDLGDPVVENVVEDFPQHPDWDGTLTNGTIVEGAIVADGDDDATPMWDDLDSPMWEGLESLMWELVWKNMTYEFQIDVSAALAGSEMIVDMDAIGPAVTLLYRPYVSEPMWDDLDDPMWTDLDELIWAVDEVDWRTWPGTLAAENGTYFFRLSTGAGLGPQGRADELTVIIDALDIEEYLNDVEIGVEGTRLPITHNFSVIKVVNLTVQDDAGDAFVAKWVDKDPVLGPLVVVRSQDGSATPGVVDAIIQGY